MTVPKRFVGLHAHSGFSIFDGLSNPTEHIDYVVENGMDAWALTDHGNMNGYPHAHQKEKDLNKSGNKFKFLPGVEAYYHPDLAEWRQAKFDHEEKKKQIRQKKSEVEFEQEDDSSSENEEATKDISKWNNPLNRRHHMVLLPKSQKGLQNIFRLVSRSHHEGNFYKFPRIDQKMLKECGEDVVVLSACIGGSFAYATLSEFRNKAFDDITANLLDDVSAMQRVLTNIGNMHDPIADAVGSENVYAELQFNRLAPQHVVNRALIEYHKKSGIKLVSTCDSHYCRPELWKEREIYKKLGRLNYDQINPDLLPKDISTLKCELYPKNAEQMWSSYKDYCAPYDFYDDNLISESIENSWHIAHDVIGNVQPDISMKLPSFVIPPGMTAMEALIEYCKEGLKKKKLHKNRQYLERMKFELSIIRDKDFAQYFLTMKAIIDIAHDQQLTGVGRGSAGGSLVCYVLGITQLDPLKYGLIFERFISMSRKDYPDIDNDLADRDLLLDGMREKFGAENVIPITNFNTLQLKSLIKDISRLYDIPFDEVNDMTRQLESDVKPFAIAEGENKSLFQLKYDDCYKYSERFRNFIEKYPHVGSSIKVLYKQNKAVSRHAGGVLVTENAEAHMPLIASRGEVQTPWTEGMHYKHLEKYGEIKYDCLGLETLRMIQRTIELILIRENKIENPEWPDISKWYDEHLSPDVIDERDEKVFDHVFRGERFAGIFQFTQKSTQKFITKFDPRCVYDLAIATAIYRPGPLAADVDRKYIEAKKDPSSVIYDHPAIEKVLKPTLGFVIFQESMMSLAHELAGMNLDDCDRLRKAIVKRSVSGQSSQKTETEVLQEMFITGAVQNGYPKDKAIALYEVMKAFASYAFNASHAVAYAFCSYQTAWLMTYYEQEWLCAYIESMIGNADDRGQAISEIKSFGYDIGKIDINESGFRWNISSDNKKFVPSFKTAKGIGDTGIAEILKNRPYKNVDELLWANSGLWKHSKLNKRALEHLIKIGAFESMKLVNKDCPSPFGSYKQMCVCIVENWDQLKKRHGKEILRELIKETADMEEWTMVELLNFRKEIVGDIDVSMVLDNDTQQYLNNKGVTSIGEIGKGKALGWFVLADYTKKLTKNNKPYLTLTALDSTGKQHRVMAWGAPADVSLDINHAYLAEIERNDFGFSTKYFRMKRLS